MCSMTSQMKNVVSPTSINIRCQRAKLLLHCNSHLGAKDVANLHSRKRLRIHLCAYERAQSCLWLVPLPCRRRTQRPTAARSLTVINAKGAKHALAKDVATKAVAGAIAAEPPLAPVAGHRGAGCVGCANPAPVWYSRTRGLRHVRPILDWLSRICHEAR